jgi:hypothetical protein
LRRRVGQIIKFALGKQRHLADDQIGPILYRRISHVDRRPAPRNNWVRPRTGPGFRRWCRRLPRRLPTRRGPPCCIRHTRRARCLRECSVPVPQAATQASRPKRLSTRCKVSRYDPSPCLLRPGHVTVNEGNSAAIHGSAFAIPRLSASAANRTHFRKCFLTIPIGLLTRSQTPLAGEVYLLTGDEARRIRSHQHPQLLGCCKGG